MKQILSEHDKKQLEDSVSEIEKRTNAQVVMAYVKRSDSYAELPWKAFAMGASVAGLLVVILSLFLTCWISLSTVFIALVATLLTGVIMALIAVFVPLFAKIFLSAHRAEEEVKQYAESLFLKKELFATVNRNGILILISLFERKVIILPDKGISNRLTEADMHKVIEQMGPSLRHNKVKRAFEEALEQLSLILDAGISSGNYENDLPNDIIEEKGL
jgi:putative membrane protein